VERCLSSLVFHFSTSSYAFCRLSRFRLTSQLYHTSQPHRDQSALKHSAPVLCPCRPHLKHLEPSTYHPNSYSAPTALNLNSTPALSPCCLRCHCSESVPDTIAQGPQPQHPKGPRCLSQCAPVILPSARTRLVLGSSLASNTAKHTWMWSIVLSIHSFI
jgi:hypothetical protein